MKRLLILLTLVFGSCIMAKADDSIPAQIWADLQANTTSHVLDNGTPGFFYDVSSHKLMSGATSELYTYRNLSLDFGVVRSIENHDHTLPVLGTNLHIGSFLAKFNNVDRLMTKLKLKQGLLQYFVMGGWAGRDFTDHVNRYGFYSGFKAEFK